MTEKDKDMHANGQESRDFDINADENQSGSTHLNDALPEEGEADKLRGDLEELRKKYLLLNADFDNFRKRNAKERVELINTANKEVIIALLDVLDDSERAAKQLESSAGANAANEGVMLVFNKFQNILQSKGLKAMEALHEEFNPDLHEAVTEIPAPTEELKGKVIDVLQKGYYLNDKIIRHARVVVGK
ncbi:nucleotide exchange factor GrpE [Chitinophaga deserti]|uniref:nucleotide exchange factor GrpE n=1 Tax=Chitinophaga deserti TaxID=2164099 RepID=UPI001E5E5A00|nr:nucleotide exchange factor GrpE [Chitinophaga deserti]